MTASKLLAEALRRLTKAHGPARWRSWGEPVGVLVATILSQNTSKANSQAGYRRLLDRFGADWNAVADAPVDEVSRCIEVSGLARTKAPRIQAILRQVREDRGRIELDFLAPMPVDEAMVYLLGFKGVGAKTARCVLLFSLGRAVFPVDTHIHRIATRLGVLEAGCSAEAAHDILTPLIAPRRRYAMHVLLIAHGRGVCLARRPRCDHCTLLELCPDGRRQLLQQFNA
jgi:endonuclease-3